MTKKVITRAVLDIKTNRWVEEESHEYDGPWAYAGAATIAQTGYAFYEDGTEAGATQIGTDTTQATIDSDTNFQTRILIQQDNNKIFTLTTPVFQYNHEGGGWNTITTSSSPIKAVNGTVTDGNNTTSRIGGTGTFVTPNAYVCEDGALPTLAYAKDGNCEALLSCQIIGSAVTDADEILVRVSGLTTYTVDADINVNKIAAPEGRRRSNVA